MNSDTYTLASPIQPIDALVAHEGPCALAVIVGVEGPSYRPVGAIMAVTEGLHRIGSLSSGCVEADIGLHAETSWQAGRPKRVRYGLGSPFKDIQLPCGGGLDILLLPDPDRDVLRQVSRAFSAREALSLSIDTDSGALEIRDAEPTGWQSHEFLLQFEPDIRFLIFGKGPEASTFAALVTAAGYQGVLLSPDEETLAAGAAAGATTRHLLEPRFPSDLGADYRTAIVLFFHDHEWEPPILKGALETPAFYIGSQGSLRARATRDMELEALNVSPGKISKMKGPIGLVRSARDARTLAVSVLAEVLAESS